MTAMPAIRSLCMLTPEIRPFCMLTLEIITQHAIARFQAECQYKCSYSIKIDHEYTVFLELTTEMILKST